MDARTLLLLAAPFLLAPAASATIIHVPGDQPTIGAAIAVAQEGDEIRVAPGTYSGAGNTGLTFGGRNLVLRSSDGPEVTIIDLAGQTRFLAFGQGEERSSVVEGFTVVGGSAPTAGGGAIISSSLQTPPSPTIRECRFIDNEAGVGGALYFCCDGGAPLIEACTFINNVAELDGGAIAVTGSAVEIRDCTFASNRGVAGDGGAIRWNVDGGLIEGCVFYDNIAERGGAVRVDGVNASVMRSCSFHRNSADTGGVLSLGIVAHVEIERCILSGSLSGGSIECGTSSSILLSCCDLFGNSGGDWIDCFAGQQGMSGNFSADPEFCDAPSDDLTLADTSPCAPENSPAGCELIGARPVGCGLTAVVPEGAPSASVELGVQPNPMRLNGVVEWMSDGGAATALRLYDPKGRLVLARDLEAGTSELLQVRWCDLVGVQNLQSGIYFLELGGAAAERQVARVIVIQ